jgi:hypothetical protein
MAAKGQNGSSGACYPNVCFVVEGCRLSEGTKRQTLTTRDADSEAAGLHARALPSINSNFV